MGKKNKTVPFVKLLVSRPVERIRWTSIYFQAVGKTAADIKRKSEKKMEKEMGKKWKVGKTAADIRDGVKKDGGL